MRTLPGAEKYLASASAKRNTVPTWAEKLIDRANEVPIFDVLADYFDKYVPREGASYKSRCPFGDEHPDGGMDKGFRTYPGSNSSNCFVMHGRMDPVRLVQMQQGVKAVRAADMILSRYGLNEHKPWRVRMSELAVEVEQRQARSVMGDPAHVVEALNIALRKEPEYVHRQFDADVLAAMEVVLDRLDRVMQTEDPERVREWYGKAKIVMLKVVRGERTS